MLLLFLDHLIEKIGVVRTKVPLAMKVPTRQLTATFLSKWRMKGKKTIQNSLKTTTKNLNFFPSTTQHLRRKREIEVVSEGEVGVTDCINHTYVIKYDEDDYGLWNDFSMMFEGQEYRYDEYRITDDGLQICRTSERLIQQKWRRYISLEKRMMAYQDCNASVDGFYSDDYTLYTDFDIFFKTTEQTFTWKDYGVIFGHVVICSEKLSLSCNEHLVKLDAQYSVFRNFSILNNKKLYDYREYRFHQNSLEICTSNDSRVQSIWRTRNAWEKFKGQYKCNKLVHELLPSSYSVDKQFTIYLASNDQYFTRNDYTVLDGVSMVCKENFRPISTEHSKEDLSMCNDSTISVEYDDDYEVWKNFSILRKNKMYDYTEYRLMNNSIHICNSSDDFVRSNWKLRNAWLKKKMHLNSCNKSDSISLLESLYYTVNKQFTVYSAAYKQYFTRNDYGIDTGDLEICDEKLKKESYEFTKDDLLICNDSIINLEYEDDYKVLNNFSIIHKNKVYDYTQYQVLNDSIKICNSTDDFLRSIWKLRNVWLKGRMYFKNCDKPDSISRLNSLYYIVNKHFTIYSAAYEQYFTRNDYGIETGDLEICDEKLKKESYQFTKEDSLICNDSIINIEYEDEYKVSNNFSILHENSVYDYKEYRVLNDSINICNSPDDFVRGIWRLRNAWLKRQMHLQSCNKTGRNVQLQAKYYIVDKKFKVYSAAYNKYFTRHDYGIDTGKLEICTEKIRNESDVYTREDLLMCNDSTINIEQNDEYEVWNNFSILYKNKMYDYTEYRLVNNSITICNSSDGIVKSLWKLRNTWLKEYMHLESCKKPYQNYLITRGQYEVFKDFTILFVLHRMLITRFDYGIFEGQLDVCMEKVKPSYDIFDSVTGRTICSNSTFNIQYEFEKYNLWTNFSIMKDGQMYHYDEYRETDDGLQVCNSTDPLIQQRWRNLIAREKKMTAFAHCNNVSVDVFGTEYFSIYNDFTVLFKPTKQIFRRQDYGVTFGHFAICSANLSFSCNDYLVKVKYGSHYNVLKNFSLWYNGNIYDHREYRFGTENIEMCTSSESKVQAIWRVANSWKKIKNQYQCKELNPALYEKKWYTVSKHFTVYFATNCQYFTRNDYAVEDGELRLCDETTRPTSRQFTKEDLLMCNNSTISIAHEGGYSVRNDFSILYKNKIYGYTEYRVLNDTIEICNSTDDFVKTTWNLRNNWLKLNMPYRSCNKNIDKNSDYFLGEYTVHKDFRILELQTNEFLERSDYGLYEGKLITCMTHCINHTYIIKFTDEYKLRNNFSMVYGRHIYDYDMYRIVHDGLEVCKSSHRLTQRRWRYWIYLEKLLRVYRKCDRSVDGFYSENYTLYKNFTVFFKPTKQSFTWKDYGVFFGHFLICSRKLMLSCDENLKKINFTDQYTVFQNFSLLYNKTIYDYDEYRFRQGRLEVCASNDSKVHAIWRARNSWEKYKDLYDRCTTGNFYVLHRLGYAVNKEFTVYSGRNGQYFPRDNYSLLEGKPAICQENVRASSTYYTQDDLYQCNHSMINIKYDENFKVLYNFSLVHKNHVYEYTEYRALSEEIKICNSSDIYLKKFWKARNDWLKATMNFKRCHEPSKYNKFIIGEYSVLNDLGVLILKKEQVISKDDYAIHDTAEGTKLLVCDEKLDFLIININIIIAPLCALAISITCLLSLLIVYCILPELQTLPGLNLMSLSFAFLLWQAYLVLFLSLFSRVGRLSTVPCTWLFVVTKFITYSIIMNAAVNSYHLKKTFCANTLAKPDENKSKNFLKYAFFSWGVPLLITVVYIILVQREILRFDEQISYMNKVNQFHLRFDQRIVRRQLPGKGDLMWEDATIDDSARIYQHITGDCINGRITPSWSSSVDVYGIQGCLLLYIIIMFVFTAHRIRQKLKESSDMAKKSNIVKNRKFVILTKLSTTTALTYWLPLLLSEMVEFNFDIKIALYSVTLLTGAYIGIAFAFTRKNYSLLKKKFFSNKQKPGKRNKKGS